MAGIGPLLGSDLREMIREKHWVVARLVKSGHEDIPIIDQTQVQPAASS